jgi:hypothetical protein
MIRPGGMITMSLEASPLKKKQVSACFLMNRSDGIETSSCRSVVYWNHSSDRSSAFRGAQ